MSKREKLRLKLNNSPKGATKQDIVTLLTAFGFVLDRVSGSHHIFIYRKDDIVQRLVIPIHRNEVKPKYVRWVIDVLDEFFRLSLMKRQGKMMNHNSLEYYMSLPYTVEVIPDEGGFVARVKELSGCITQGDTWEEVGDMIEDAKRLWLESALEHGDPIPEPLGVFE